MSAREIAVDVIDLAVLAGQRGGAAAGQGKGAALAVDGEGDEVLVIQARRDLVDGHRLEVDGADGIARVGRVGSLVGKEIGVIEQRVGQVLVGDVEQAIDLAVLGVLGHAGRLQAVPCRADLLTDQVARLGIPLAHIEAGGVVDRGTGNHIGAAVVVHVGARHHGREDAVVDDGARVGIHHIEVGHPQGFCLVGDGAVAAEFFLVDGRELLGHGERRTVPFHLVETLLYDKDRLHVGIAPTYILTISAVGISIVSACLINTA